MILVSAKRATHHRICVPPAQQHAADQGGVAPHLGLGDLRRHPVPVHQTVVLVPQLAITRIGFGIDHVEITLRHQIQTDLLDAHLDHARASDQDGARQFLVDDDPNRMQHTLILALGEQYPLVLQRHCLGRIEHWLHDDAGLVNEVGQAGCVGNEILDRLGCDARIHRSTRHCGRNLDDEAGIKGLRNDVVRSETQIRPAIGRGDDIALLRTRQFGNCLDAGQFHLLGDRGRTDIERPTEDERKAQHVVDLIRKVRPAGGHNAVRADLLRVLRENFRIGVGERKDQRLVRHPRDHLRFQHPGGRQTQKHVRPFDDLAQGAGLRLLSIAGLVGLHVLVTPNADHAL